MADEFVAGSNPVLEFTFLDQDRAAIDLTGSTVELKYRIEGGAIQTKSMTITNATSGIAEYRFQAGDLTAGHMSYEGVITDAASNVYPTRKRFLANVRAAL